ncbi:MAG: RNA chaperone Hfq [Alphaproteobacteria bacterium]|nr:RNA chaperone Hfq [Alphaproteobacteria bacterium]MBQ3116928.1 RNA chaperone Hfq [Alphaproteobacteria bacterium]MBQ6854265.1 RNA chaperone Hfq [Alphaproteobacteria bacterium]MBQ8557398.1 RNA chaperone Hfq [Alphaproteobacteria bacterium]MBR3913500.1 RNA chaperone Hfq [Alphaproteobacteria bacterium]
MFFSEEKFLKILCKDQVPATVFLTCGVKLQGIITSFDKYVLFLRRDGHTQMIYKSAVSTVMPSMPIEAKSDDE